MQLASDLETRRSTSASIENAGTENAGENAGTDGTYPNCFPPKRLRDFSPLRGKDSLAAIRTVTAHCLDLPPDQRTTSDAPDIYWQEHQRAAVHDDMDKFFVLSMRAKAQKPRAASQVERPINL